MLYYKATANENIEVVVVCEACGHKFSYTRHFMAESARYLSPTGATEAASARLESKLRGFLSKGHLGCKICPRCEYIQSWMADSFVRRRAALGGGVGLALSVSPIFIFLCNWLGATAPMRILGSALTLLAGISCAAASWVMARSRVAAMRARRDHPPPRRPELRYWSTSEEHPWVRSAEPPPKKRMPGALVGCGLAIVILLDICVLLWCFIP